MPYNVNCIVVCGDWMYALYDGVLHASVGCTYGSCSFSLCGHSWARAIWLQQALKERTQRSFPRSSVDCAEGGSPSP